MAFPLTEIGLHSMPDYFPDLRGMGFPFSVDCKFAFAPSGSIISVDCQLCDGAHARLATGDAIQARV
jgi:hypothetical protein